jgi:hypothetical protein
MNDYRPEIKSLIRTLKKHGFVPHILNDGGELFRGSAITVEEIVAVDECHLYVKDINDKKYFIYIVLGNDPGEAPCDYSGNCEQLESAIEEHYERWENKKQPTM